ncbi:MAG: oxaloacetate decarboxylase alpha subunit [Halieaceae bacterium]|jgi:oxaloacetate decarboxylase alpha subunit
MTTASKPLGITELVLRDAHQSLFATRMRLDDMLPIAAELDAVGFWSLESWGGATFDACIRYLGEDPWVRIRELKAAMPNTPQQMLLRGQNLLGYRHYADDVVEKFVERAAVNGVDVFRVFDAMNDMRNIEVALRAVKTVGKHAQGTIAYTLSPVHSVDLWVEQGKRIEDMGADSIAIKDMAGLLRPYVGFELVSRLKASCSIPIHMQCHATTGMSTATNLKCIEAGIDNIDTAISSMSMTYGHSPTEALVAILEGTDRDTGLDLTHLERIASYFREVRKKYAKFEGSLRGVDSRILVAQVPGGMLTNMENQLREQNASDRLAEVLEEIPAVRKDLGYIPLVTPTSQIVGTQAVLNVLTGERYKSISRETAGVLKGEYGHSPAPVNAELQARVLEGAQPITCRPADLIPAELDALSAELAQLAAEQSISLAPGEQFIDEVLTYALFPQVGLRFLSKRGDPEAFEAPPGIEPAAPAAEPAPALVAAAATESSGVYTVTVAGQRYVVEVNEGGDITELQAAAAAAPPAHKIVEVLKAPLAGNIVSISVAVGDAVVAGDVVIILEAMKMETEVRVQLSGTVTEIAVAPGDAVTVGDRLLDLDAG